MFLDLGPDHLQHDEFPGAVLVSERDDGALVITDTDVEDVDSRAERTDLLGSAQLPHSNSSVTRSRDNDFIITGDCSTPHLK